MKKELSVFLSVIVSFICAFLTYFLNYLALPFAIITFFIVLLVFIAIYFSYWLYNKIDGIEKSLSNLDKKIDKIETTNNRNALVLNVIINIFIKIQKLPLRRKEISMDQFISTFSEGVEEILGTITKDYFSTHSSIPSEDERKKQELLEKARLRTILPEEGQELQELLEKQKRQHESSGDIGGAILLGLLILFVVGILVILFGGEKKD